MRFEWGDLVLLAFPFASETITREVAGLIAPSTVRLHKIATVEKRLVKRKLGSLQERDRSAAWAAFRRIYCGSEAPRLTPP